MSKGQEESNSQKNHIKKSLNTPALLVLLIGFTSLMGWWIDHKLLVQFIPQIHNMTFNTALGFVLAGGALLLNRHAKILRFLGVLLGVFALLTLSQDLFGFSLGLDTLFFQYDGLYEDKLFPGRLSPNTAIAFSLVGLLFFLFSAQKPKQFAVLHLSLIAVLLLFAGLGFVMTFLFSGGSGVFAHFASMSLFTSIAFLLLSWGTWQLYSQQHPESHRHHFFLPAMLLMDHCKYRQKFLLITLFFFIPLSALTYTYISESHIKIEFIQQRQVGLQYFDHLFYIFETVPQHRGMRNAYLSGDFSFESEIVRSKITIEHHIQQLNELHQSLPHPLGIDAPWDEFQKKWKELSASTQISPEQSWKEHTQLIEDVMTLMRHVGFQSGLMKDPEWMDTYLIGGLLDHLPPLLESIGKTRGLGSGVLAKKEISEKRRFELTILSSQISTSLKDLNNVFALLELKTEQSVWKDLLASKITHDDAIARFVAVLNNEVIRPEIHKIAAKAFFELGTQTLDHGFFFFREALNQSAEVLKQHQNSISMKNYLFIFMELISLVLVFYLLNGFYFSVEQTVSILEHNAHCMAQGNMKDSMVLKSKDELSGIITAFNEVGASLLSTTAYMKSIIDHAVDGIIILNAQGEIQTFSPAAARIFGRTESEMMGKEATLLMPEEFREKHRSGLKHRLGQQEKHNFSQTLELKGLRKDGSQFPLELSLTGMALEGESLFLGIVRDITQRKEAEARLILLSEVIEQTDEAVLITDLKGDLIFVNHAFELLTGYSKAEVLGINPRILKSGKQNHEFYVTLWKTLTEGKVWKNTLVNKCKDGSFYDVEDTIVPIRNSEGTLINYVGIQRDITEKLIHQKQQDEMQRLESLGVLAGGIAHDFNNLLAVMMGHAEVVKMMTLPNLPQYNSLQCIEKAGKRAAELCKQMLAYAGKGQFEKRLIHLSEFITASLDALKTSLSETVTLELKLEKELPLIQGDSSQIQQVLVSLITNASESLESKDHTGTIQLVTRSLYVDQKFLDAQNRSESISEGEFVALEIVDTGCGMDEATLEKIFDPFFSTKFTGRGLGMSAVQGIVRGHSGALILESQKDVGTRVQVLFPVTQAGSEA